MEVPPSGCGGECFASVCVGGCERLLVSSLFILPLARPSFILLLSADMSSASSPFRLRAKNFALAFAFAPFVFCDFSFRLVSSPLAFTVELGISVFSHPLSLALPV